MIYWLIDWLIDYIISWSETCLDNSYHSDNNQLALSGYNLIRAENPNNIKRGGVSIYYQEILPARVVNVNILNECLCNAMNVLVNVGNHPHSILT